MTTQTDDGAQELADKHDGVELDRTHIQASFEYSVELTPEKIASMPDDVDVREFASSLAVSRFEQEVDPTFSTSPQDTFVRDETDVFHDGREFTVLVRHDANE